jgi:hypothetical protein
MEQEAAHYRKLSDDWLVTLKEVQKLDEFQDFLSPAPIVKLQSAAANGPIIILNATEFGCAALVVTLCGVTHIPLPKFTVRVAETLTKLIRFANNSGSECSEMGLAITGPILVQVESLI